MKKLLRYILLMPKPKVSYFDALRIAKLEYEKRGGTQWNPCVLEGLRSWTVVARKGIKGATRIVIDQQSGKIIEYTQLSK